MSIPGNLTDLKPTQALEACRAYAQKMRTLVLTNPIDIEPNVPRNQVQQVKSTGAAREESSSTIEFQQAQLLDQLQLLTKKMDNIELAQKNSMHSQRSSNTPTACVYACEGCGGTDHDISNCMEEFEQGMEHEQVDYVGGQHQNPYQQPNQQPQNYNKGQNSYQSSGQNFNKGQSNYQARGQLGQSNYRTPGTQPPQNPNTYRNQGNYQQNR